MAKKPEKKFRAIGITCGIGSMLVGAKQAGFDILSNVEFRRYYHWKDERGRNTFIENFPGAIFKEKINEFTPQEIEKIMGADIALGHPECFLVKTPVYTPKGWVPIGDIKPGDQVLTKEGRFKPVVQVIDKIYEGNMVRIRTGRGAGEDGSLTLTPNHPLFINGDWVRAENIRPGDTVKVLCVECRSCGEPIPVFRTRSKKFRGFCSVSCSVKSQWERATPAERKILTQKAHEQTRKNCKDQNHPFYDREIKRKAMIASAKKNFPPRISSGGTLRKIWIFPRPSIPSR